MGTSSSSRRESTKSSKTSTQHVQKTMTYKRQFSSEKARETQNDTYNTYRQKTLDRESMDIDNEPATIEEPLQHISSTSPDVLDPEKYKPPPTPVVNDDIATDKTNKNKDNNNVETIKEESNEHSDDSMTEAEALQIEKTKQRALSPGLVLLTNDDQKEQHKNEAETDTMEVPSADNLIKHTSNHAHIASKSEHSIPSTALKWGYCELTRKRLCEDQAAFLTWEHPIDGFIHAWAVFDGHGGYDTALYSAQHFLKYVQKHHLQKEKMEKNEWKSLMRQIFLKFDEHIGTLNIRGGSTVVVVLLINNFLICANAGDARAILSKNNGNAVELSYDHTPMRDYDRLVEIAKKPENFKKINKFFRINPKSETYEEAQIHPDRKKAPFISKEMDKSRLLGTIGVARGFGDFSLTVFGFKSLPLKLYLSAEPFVNVYELQSEQILETDLMCIACDGVFDVLSNQEVIDELRAQIFYKQEKNDNVDDQKDKENEDKKEANLEFDIGKIDKACSQLGRISYAKGTMDDVTIFAVPLKQIFEFSKNNSNQQ